MPIESSPILPQSEVFPSNSLIPLWVLPIYKHVLMMYNRIFGFKNNLTWNCQGSGIENITVTEASQQWSKKQQVAI